MRLFSVRNTGKFQDLIVATSAQEAIDIAWHYKRARNRDNLVATDFTEKWGDIHPTLQALLDSGYVGMCGKWVDVNFIKWQFITTRKMSVAEWNKMKV